MGCSSSDAGSDPSDPWRPRDYRGNLRSKYTIGEALGFNSTTGLFKARAREPQQPQQLQGQDGDNLYIRFASYNKDSLMTLQKRFQGIFNIQRVLPAFVPYIAEGHTPTHYYVVMDTKGSLPVLEAITDKQFTVTESTLGLGIRGVFDTLRQLHEHSIPHGQISPAKLLLKQECFMLFDPCTSIEAMGDLLSENCYFLAPEVLNGEPVSRASDVWALGATLYYLATGHTVFPRALTTDYVQYATNHEPDFSNPQWDNTSASFKELVMNMLAARKQERISMRDACAHDWIQKQFLAGKSLLCDLQFVEQAAYREKWHMKAVYWIGSEKSKADISELSKDLANLDYTHSGLLDISVLMSHALTHDHPKHAQFSEVKVPESYPLLLLEAQALNQLVATERLAVIFFRLSKGGELLSHEALHNVLLHTGQSGIISSPSDFEKRIRSFQVKPRTELSLTFKEFAQFFEQLNHHTTEEWIYDNPF